MMKKNRILDRITNLDKTLWKPLVAVVCNFAMAMILMTICRLLFYLDNRELFTDLDLPHFFEILKGGLLFDLSILCYADAVWILLMLVPLPYNLRVSEWYRKICKWFYVIPNLILVLANLADTVYFPYVKQRATFQIFKEFSNESGGLAGVFIKEAFCSHWYFTLLFILIAAAVWYVYIELEPVKDRTDTLKNRITYWITTPVLFVLIWIPVVGGMRGGFAYTTPLGVNQANQYVDNALHTGIVLNTPFSIVRTMHTGEYIVPDYFEDRNQMFSIYSPVTHIEGKTPNNMNVVVIIAESFGLEYKNMGLMPFVDSLSQQGVYFKFSFSNGTRSIDAMPSILSSIPKLQESFFVSDCSFNKVTSLASVLRDNGYSTSFFHGASNGSMGLEAYARQSGFDNYYGMNEYYRFSSENSSTDADKDGIPDFAGHADYDKGWAIFDEPFLKYSALQIGQMKEPFCASLFTATSHHPFPMPDKYKDVFTKGTHPMHRCIQYSDYSLEQFFKVAKLEPWFNNTLFIITADHTSKSANPLYMNECALFRVPIILYKPGGVYVDGEQIQGEQTAVVHHADIMPTVLSLLGVDTTLVTFGQDIFRTPVEDKIAYNFNLGLYQYYNDSLMLQFDGENAVGLYRYRTDSILENNIIENGQYSETVDALSLSMKSILQQYLERMKGDSLVIE